MNISIIFLDTIAFLAAVAALIFLLLRWRRIEGADIRILLFFLFMLNFFYVACLWLEWSGINRLLEVYENFTGALIPMFWAFVLYAFMQRGMTLDLQKSEERYRSLFDAAKDSLFMMKGDRYIECNRSVTEMFGCTREEIIGSLPQMWSPEFQPNGRKSNELAGELIAAALSGRNQLFEWRHLRKNGERFDVEVSLVRVDIDDEPYLLAIVRDITDRKNAERALHRSEENLRQVVARQSLILDSLPMAFYTATVSGDYGGTWVSEQIHKISGFSSQQFLSEPEVWAARVHPDDRQAVMAAFAGLSENDRLVLEYRWQHADGEYRWFKDHAVLVGHDDGSPGVIIGAWLDITEEKTVGEEREDLERQLIQSQKLESIATLAGGIAHDFNNILFPMIGYLEMILRELDQNDPLQRKVNRVLEGALRAKGLVRQILSISRRTEEQDMPFNIGLIVKEAVDLSRASLPASIDIHADIDMDLGNVMTTPSHIHQIVMNLVTNAFHAMEETGGRLNIRLKKSRLNGADAGQMNLMQGDHILLTVSDTGKGMSAEVVERVFDPYFTTKEAGKGTGLGLFVVHGLVNRYRGAVKIESVPGKGTDFHVYLPVSLVKIDEPGPPPEKTAAYSGNECVLIVDDEENITLMMRTYLENYGYEVLTINSGRAALEKMRSADGDRVALVITDMVMPEMDGLTLAEKIHFNYPDLPVVLMTGYSEQITEERIIRAGVRDKLFKPFSPLEIIKIVRGLLDSQTERIYREK